jgi:thioester reductase-like protein
MSKNKAMEKLINNLEWYDIWDSLFSERINIIVGDISKENLGLEASIYTDLAGTSSLFKIIFIRSN